MKAKTCYVLDYPKASRWSDRLRRRKPGEDEIRIADHMTGRILGRVNLLPGDDGLIGEQMEADLLNLSPEEFAAKWIAASPST